MPPGSDNNVKIGVEVDIPQSADRALEVLANRIEKMNGGASVVGGSSSFGSLTPSGAPKPGTGLEGYASGSYSTGGTYSPPGMGTGVLSSGSVYSPTNLLAPGALAPNPLTGNASGGSIPNGSGAGGNTTIMAGSVTVVGGGSSPQSSVGGATGWPGGTMPSWAAPSAGGSSGGAPAPISANGSGGGNGNGGGNNNPLPGGWNPFGGGGGGSPQPGFMSSLYDAMPGGMQGALAQRFLGHSPIGRQLIGMGANFEGFLPEGMGASLGGLLGKAAPILGVASMARDMAASGLHVASEYQLPGIFQEIRESSYKKSGTFYDPIQLARDRRMAEIEARERATEAVYNSGFMRTVRYVAPWIDYQHDTDYRRKVEGLKSDTNALAEFETSRRDFLLTTGVMVPDRPRGAQAENDLFRQKAAYNRGLGPLYGYGQAKPSYLMDYHDYGRYGDTPDAVNAASGRVASYMMGPGFENQSLQIMGGRDVRDFFGTTLNSAIARGDTTSINDMAPLFVRAAGGDLQKGLAAMQTAMKRGVAVQRLGTNQAIGTANLSAGQAQIGLLEASGASGYTVAASEGALSSTYDGIIQALQGKLSAVVASGNPLDISRARAELAQAVTARQSVRKQSEMMRFSTRQTEIGTESSLAGTFLQRAMYGSDESTVIGSFGRQSNASQSQVALYRKMSRSAFLSPEERKQYAAEAEAAQNQIDYEIPRQIGGFQLGLRQGELGLYGARESVISQNAGLYGGIGDVYKASIGQADVIRQQLNLTGRELGGEFGPRTQQEKLDLQRQQIDLQRQLNGELEQARRSFMTANLSVAQFSQGVTQSTAGYRQAFFGVGGGAAAANQGVVVEAARSTLTVAQSNFDAVKNLPKDNPFRQQAERALIDARTGAQSAVQSYAQLPVSVDLQREQAAGQFRLSAISRTYMPFGDIRGTVAGLMKNVGAQGKELGTQQRAGLAAIDADSTLTAQERAERKSVLLRDFEARRYGLGNELLGYQSQLETGWQDRLISSVVGMPGRGTFVASQFTRKEAAPFLQQLSSVFGFSGRDAESHRDNYMFRGPRLANSVQGVIQRPDGFMDTSMAIAAGGGHGQVLRPSVGGGGTSGSGANIEQAARALIAAITSAVGNGGNGGNPLGMGKSSNTLHHVTNNWDLLRPHFGNNASHQ